MAFPKPSNQFVGYCLNRYHRIRKSDPPGTHVVAEFTNGNFNHRTCLDPYWRILKDEVVLGPSEQDGYDGDWDDDAWVPDAR